MRKESGQFAVEMAFVLTMVWLLKEWVFPFWISKLFQNGDATAMMTEWMILMVAVITGIVYIGLGSSAKYQHALSFSNATLIFAAVHGTYWLSGTFFPLIREGCTGLLGDGIRLFAGGREVEPLIIVTACYLLFLLGRKVNVKESSYTHRQTQTRSIQKSR
jgi:glucose-6-phosphate-specific signal transduction histidine kinase